jgi:hypothetical protein
MQSTNTLIASIGQTYTTSFFSGSGFSKTSLTLTEDSISGVGKTYQASGRGIISFTGDLRNVSSLGMEYKSYYILLLLGILTLIVGVGVIFLIMYFASKERYIIINFQGYVYALSLRGISNADVDAFIATTRHQIAKVKN